jgi:hypothetical protein
MEVVQISCVTVRVPVQVRGWEVVLHEYE